MVESKQKDLVILLWLLSAEFYELLRQIPGCDHLDDLKATKKDNISIIEMADRLGIKKEHRWIDIDPTFEKVNASFKAIFKL